MIWLNYKTDQIRPVLNSLRGTNTHRRHTEIQQDLYQHEINWKIVGSIISLIIFIILLCSTIVGLPIILTKVKQEPICPTTTNWIEFPTSSIQSSINDAENSNSTAKRFSNELRFIYFVFQGSMRLCTANASWNPVGITVAGLASGLSSSSLADLQFPYDIYVYENGSILVADSSNNRITKWDPNVTVGVLVAGTGSYGSWINLLAKPMALAVRNDQLYVSDVENYRIQVFPLNTSLCSPDAVTLIGRYGQGPDINQINQVTSIVAPASSPSLLYMSDLINQRILLWDSARNISKVVAGQSGIFGSDSTHLNNPFGITLNERTNSLYIADRSNNRIQKYDMNEQHPILTVAGWGQLNAPYAVQLDPSGINMFIADTLNHRILVWLNGALQGRVIAGNSTVGNSAIQLNTPTQIRFDSNYNLYVVDTNNSRIQRFDLISNGC